MPWTDKHIRWFRNTGATQKTKDGKKVDIWEFNYDQEEQEIIVEWAKHFRNHYCLDTDIDNLRTGTGLSRSNYLIDLIFPDEKDGFGPSVRAGDFGEILVADFLQYLLDFWVPRTRYCDKTIRNETTKGCDVIAMKFHKDGKETPDDNLTIFEVKAQLTRIGKINGLQKAIEDSANDQMRKAESLNAIKQRFFATGKEEEGIKIARFQNPQDNPYRETFGAAGVFSTEIYDASTIEDCEVSMHPNQNKLMLLVFHGQDLMKLVHELYRRAAVEA